MPLVTLRTVLAARRVGAVAAFTVAAREEIQAVVSAAEAEHRPVIIQASPKQIQAAGIEALCAEVEATARLARMPIAFQLDHARSPAEVYPALRHGFTSIMYDASELPYADNVAATRQIVEMAHGMGVSVEGELGHIGGVEDDHEGQGGEAFYTDPKQAVDFVEATGVDALAVAIGTAHGIFKSAPKLDFGRLEQLVEAVPVPIVIHGGSGLDDKTYRRLCSLGAQKINIGTEMKVAYMDAIKQFVAQHPDEDDPRKLLPEVRGAGYRLARAKIKLFAGR